MQRLILAGLLATAWLSAGGCDASEDELSIELVSTPPEQAAVEVAYPRIRLPAGMVLAVEFRRQGGLDRDFASDAEFSVFSETPKIARPIRTPDNRRFLIVAHQEGEAIFQIQLGEERFDPLRVEVSKPRSEKKER